jgi:hypothetical protein
MAGWRRCAMSLSQADEYPKRTAAQLTSQISAARNVTRRSHAHPHRQHPLPPAPLLRAYSKHEHSRRPFYVYHHVPLCTQVYSPSQAVNHLGRMITQLIHVPPHCLPPARHALLTSPNTGTHTPFVYVYDCAAALFFIAVCRCTVPARPPHCPPPPPPARALALLTSPQYNYPHPLVSAPPPCRRPIFHPCVQVFSPSQAVGYLERMVAQLIRVCSITSVTTYPGLKDFLTGFMYNGIQPGFSVCPIARSALHSQVGFSVGV